MIAFESDDNAIGICDIDGAMVGYLEGHEHPPNNLVFSPDGKTICTASEDKRIIIWDVETFKPLKIITGHRHDVY